MNGTCDSAYVPLSRGLFAVVARVDEGGIAGYRWYAHNTGRQIYAARSVTTTPGKRRIQYMHRFLLPDAPMVDHINGDRLDNRRANLRPATPGQNQANRKAMSAGTSRCLGVHWFKSMSRWRSEIRVPQLDLHLSPGYFFSEEEAARHYDAAARIVHGEFARLNFPGDPFIELRPTPAERLAPLLGVAA